MTGPRNPDKQSPGPATGCGADLVTLLFILTIVGFGAVVDLLMAGPT
mgnify:FL=1